MEDAKNFQFDFSEQTQQFVVDSLWSLVNSSPDSSWNSVGGSALSTKLSKYKKAPKLVPKYGSENGKIASSSTSPNSDVLVPLMNLAELQLRFLCPTDLTEVRKLCNEWFPIEYPDAWYRDITSDPKFYSLAAVYGGQVVGLMVAEQKSCQQINKEDTGLLDPSLVQNCQVGYILSLGVCDGFRRHGVASLLLENYLAHLTTPEKYYCKAVYLHVLTTNSAALRFYEKHRFRLHAFLPYYYSIHGRSKDGFTYVMYINDGHPPWSLLDYVFHWCERLYSSRVCHIPANLILLAQDWIKKCLLRSSVAKLESM
nr:EOG090X0BM0 [Lepidurus arcticus]